MRSLLGLVPFFLLLGGCAGVTTIDAEHPAVLVDRVQAAAVVDDVMSVLAPGRVVATSSFDGCQKGRDGWKMNDPDFVCTVVESRVVPVVGVGDDVGQGLAVARDAMADLGCGTDSRFLDEADLESPSTTPMGFRCEDSGLQISLLALVEGSPEPQAAEVYGAPVARELLREPFPDDVVQRVATAPRPVWQVTVSRTYALVD